MIQDIAKLRAKIRAHDKEIKRVQRDVRTYEIHQRVSLYLLWSLSRSRSELKSKVSRLVAKNKNHMKKARHG